MSVTFDRLAVDRVAMKYANISKELAIEIAKSGDEDDKFKIKARKIIFAKFILIAPWTHQTYNQIYWEIHKYETPVTGLDELTALIKSIGWKQFLLCLEFYVAKRGYAMITIGAKVTQMGVVAVIKKVQGLPKWLGNTR